MLKERINNFLKEDFKVVVERIISRLLEEPSESIKAQDYNLNDEVRKAHQEWVRAGMYFQSVSEPDLIDHAIYIEEAAKRKYEYLLKKAKSSGISESKIQ